MDVELTGVERWQNAPEPPAPVLIKMRAETRPADLPRASSQRLKFLAAEGQTPSELEIEAALGTNDLVEASFLDKCQLVRECIGRLRYETDRGRAYATCFLIAPGLAMTNHHVFPTRQSAEGGSLDFGYRRNVAGLLPLFTEEYSLDPGAFFVSDPDLDFAVLAVSPRSTGGREILKRSYLRLIPESGKADKGAFVTIIQHPDGDAMQVALRENEVTEADKDKPFIWYQADTAHGSSGSPVFNDSFQVVALHASGRIRRDAQNRYALKDGTFVENLKGVSEKDVIWEANVGFRVSRICKKLIELARLKSAAHADALEAAMNGGDVLSLAVERAKLSGGAAEPAAETESMEGEIEIVEKKSNPASRSGRLSRPPRTRLASWRSKPKRRRARFLSSMTTSTSARVSTGNSWSWTAARTRPCRHSRLLARTWPRPLSAAHRPS
jgi:endonuclease G